MNIKELKRKFRAKLRRMSDKEMEEFDNWFVEIEDSLLDFYGIREMLMDNEERKRFLDYLYMYAIAFNKNDFDERYDQQIFGDALIYAKRK